MKVLGIIPARSGSKGIPNKNIKLLHGKSLIAYTIESALKSELLSQTIISTDSIEIQEVARNLDVKVPFLRPNELAQDDTPTIDVIVHSLLFFEKIKETFDAVCLLQPTSPFRSLGFIDKCILEFERSGADSLISVLQVPPEHNPYWTFTENDTGFLKISTGSDHLISRRQELPKAFFRDGSIYLTKVDLIKTCNKLVGGDIAYVLSDPNLYCNLDTLQDWQKAELMLTK